MTSPVVQPIRVRRIGRVRLTTRSVLITIALFALALIARTVVGRSHRVLGWLLAAIIVAALVHPIVEVLSRRMRRGVALVIVIVGVLGSVAFVTYTVVDSVRAEMRRLQVVAPDAAARIEDSRRFGQAARDFGLEERVRDFVDELPRRLAGGDAPEALRSAASRGVAYLAAGVLTLFVLGHGPRILRAGLAQIDDVGRREQTKRILESAYRRAWNYVSVELAVAVAVGVVTTIVCRLADIPGAAALGLFVGAFSLVPYIGIVMGAIPIGLLAIGLRSVGLALVLFGAFVVIQLGDVIAMRRQLHRHSVNVGPALTLIVVMMGFELYGIGGSIVGLAVTVFAVAVADEIATDFETAGSAGQTAAAGSSPDNLARHDHQL